MTENTPITSRRQDAVLFTSGQARFLRLHTTGGSEVVLNPIHITAFLPKEGSLRIFSVSDYWEVTETLDQVLQLLQQRPHRWHRD